MMTSTMPPRWLAGPLGLLRAAQARISDARGCFLTFHRGAPSALWAELPDRNYYLDLGYLDRLLGHLARTGWAVVTIEEALGRAARNLPGDRYVNFSIDDCYRDTYEEVVPLFRRHGVPVTLFVTTGIPDNTLSVWSAGLEAALAGNDRLELEDGPLVLRSARERRAAFARILARWDGPRAVEHYHAFCARNGLDHRALHARYAITWEMLEDLRYDPCVEIGAHTVNHARVSNLGPAEARAEIAGSRARLQERLGIPVRHFAFPYGRSADCGPRDLALAREAGFASACTTSKGRLRKGQDPFGLPRNTLNGAHRNLALAEAHLRGLSGALARVTGRV